MNENGQSDSILDRIRIAMPCSVDWNDMKGGDQVRLCGGCNKNVYNISAMSKKEAEEILQNTKLPCLQLERREDGSVVTDECPKFLRGIRSLCYRVASMALSLFAVLLPQASSASDLMDKRLPLKGKTIRADAPEISTPPGQSNKTYTTVPLSKLIKHRPNMHMLGRTCTFESFPKGSIKWCEALALQEWPDSLAALGFKTDDIVPLDPFYPDIFKQLKRISPAAMTIDSVEQDPKATSLFRESWVLAEQARKEHMRACIHLVRKEYTECVRVCQASSDFYYMSLQALNSAPSKDAKFAEFLELEKNKVLELKSQATSAFNGTPEKKIEE